MGASPRSRTGRRTLRFGAAYYAEYTRSDRMKTDLDLMAEADVSVIRVGESVWSTWEPRDGEFDLEWLAPVLDAAAERDIDVVLGTPTYAVPPWLQRSHPEIAAHRRTGRPIPWGARQEADFTHPVFRRHAERVIRAVVGRYAGHPAVVGYQLDNEPGLELLHSPHVFEEFVRRLRARYHDVGTLNREWGLTYWSHRIAEWDELWVPDGNTVPQYDLAWRRFQADLTTEFIAWQAGIVGEYRRDDQFLTTCLSYSRPAVDDRRVTEGLDVTAANIYYGTQDHLALEKDLSSAETWTTTGPWGLFRQADRAYSSRQERFLVTETNATSVGGADHNFPPFPGQLAQVALALVARGAEMIEYWHWHTLSYGAETYWGGVLPHSLRPGRVYREVAELGRTLRRLEPALDDYRPDADVALLWSAAGKWALEFQPPLRGTGGPDRGSYGAIVDAFHRGVIDAGAQARFVHVEQAEDLGAAALYERFPVLVVPALYVTTDAQLALLRDYALAGGHLILGIRTAYADAEARARAEIAPAGLHEAAGVWYEEYSNLGTELPLRGGPGFTPSPGARATRWADGLVPDGAEVLASYDHPDLGRFPALTTAAAGSGRITYVGTVPNPALAADLLRWAVPHPVAADWLSGARGSVTVASGTVDGGRIWFLHHWGPRRSTVVAPCPARDLIAGTEHAAGTTLELGPWSALVLAES